MKGAGNSILLLGAVLQPVLYFGVQPVLAPTYPNYSFMADAVSLLGSDRSPYATVFNVVLGISGLCGIAAGIGLFRALRADRCPLILNLVIVIVVMVAAAGSIWAGVYPLPDPRHGGNPTGPALLALPMVFATASFMVPRLQRWRIYFVANLLVMAAVVAMITGVIPLDRAQYGGLLQRILAFACFVPIAVASATMRRESAETGASHQPARPTA